MAVLILLAFGSPTREIPFEVIAEGKISEIQEKTFQAIRDAGTWDSVWTRIAAGKIPPPEQPAVSFEDSMLILVASGSRGVMNRSVRVQKIVARGDALTVFVEICEPPEGAIVLPAFSQPYQVVRLPRFDGEVAFKEVPCEKNP